MVASLYYRKRLKPSLTMIIPEQSMTDLYKAENEEDGSGHHREGHPWIGEIFVLQISISPIPCPIPFAGVIFIQVSNYAMQVFRPKSGGPWNQFAEERGRMAPVGQTVQQNPTTFKQFCITFSAYQYVHEFYIGWDMGFNVGEITLLGGDDITEYCFDVIINFEQRDLHDPLVEFYVQDAASISPFFEEAARISPLELHSI